MYDYIYIYIISLSLCLSLYILSPRELGKGLVHGCVFLVNLWSLVCYPCFLPTNQILNYSACCKTHTHTDDEQRVTPVLSLSVNFFFSWKFFGGYRNRFQSSSVTFWTVFCFLGIWVVTMKNVFSLFSLFRSTSYPSFSLSLSHIGFHSLSLSLCLWSFHFVLKTMPFAFLWHTNVKFVLIDTLFLS